MRVRHRHPPRVCSQLKITMFAYIYNAATILLAVFLSVPIARTTEVVEMKEADYRHATTAMRTSSPYYSREGCHVS